MPAASPTTAVRHDGKAGPSLTLKPHHPQALPERSGTKVARKLASASPALKQKAQVLLDILAVDPDQQPPPCETLVGNPRGACSRRLKIQHRLVVQVLDEEQIVKVLRLWSHDA